MGLNEVIAMDFKFFEEMSIIDLQNIYIQRLNAIKYIKSELAKIKKLPECSALASVSKTKEMELKKILAFLEE